MYDSKCDESKYPAKICGRNMQSLLSFRIVRVSGKNAYKLFTKKQVKIMKLFRPYKFNILYLFVVKDVKSNTALFIVYYLCTIYLFDYFFMPVQVSGTETTIKTALVQRNASQSK